MKKDRDLKIEYCLAAGILLVLFRLWPASRQMIFILPLSAPIDDEPYFVGQTVLWPETGWGNITELR